MADRALAAISSVGASPRSGRKVEVTEAELRYELDQFQDIAGVVFRASKQVAEATAAPDKSTASSAARLARQYRDAAERQIAEMKNDLDEYEYAIETRPEALAKNVDHRNLLGYGRSKVEAARLQLANCPELRAATSSSRRSQAQ
jgi:hypothetical protein